MCCKCMVCTDPCHTVHASCPFLGCVSSVGVRVDVGMATFATLLREVWKDVSAGTMPTRTSLEQLSSLGLGYAMVAGAALLKLPQIAALVRARSAQGIKKESVEIEVMAYVVTCLYAWQKQLPFSAYGEAVFLAVQSAALCGLVYKYQNVGFVRQSMVVGPFLAAFGAAVTGRLDKAWIETMFDAVAVMVLAARLPQILVNFKYKSTGQLSLVTVGLTFLGGVARIFTSIQENAGRGMVQSYVLASVMNAILTGQILYYRGYSKARLAARKAKGKERVR